MVLKKIASLKKELVQVRRNRETQRKKRRNLPVPSLSVVGYTNAGKSSLLNMMTGADVAGRGQALRHPGTPPPGESISPVGVRW